MSTISFADYAVFNEEFKKVSMYLNIMPITSGTLTTAMCFICALFKIKSKKNATPSRINVCLIAWEMVCLWKIFNFISSISRNWHVRIFRALYSRCPIVYSERNRWHHSSREASHESVSFILIPFNSNCVLMISQ